MFAVPSILSFFFYVSFVAIWIGLTEINALVLGLPDELWRSFLFLPHAVRVLSAVYLGWAGFPGLLLGHLLAWYVIFDDISVLQVLAIVVSACGCNLAVLLLQSSYIGPKVTNVRSFNEGLYRHVFLVGLVGSLIISTVNGIFLYSPAGVSLLDPMMTLRFIVGDMLGLVVTIFVIALVRAYVKSHFSKDPV